MKLMKDHKGNVVETNEHTVYHGYAYQVECPHCGVDEGETCEVTDSGGRTGEIRSPHQERAELARELVEQTKQ